MLQYRLDKDAALVVVSAWDHAEGMERAVATIEHMTKVVVTDALVESLTQEWSAALTAPPVSSAAKYFSPRKGEYWDRPVKRLRRMESEATADSA